MPIVFFPATNGVSVTVCIMGIMVSAFFFDTTPLGDFVLPGLPLYELPGRRWGSLSNLSAKPGEEQWGERLWE